MRKFASENSVLKIYLGNLFITIKFDIILQFTSLNYHRKAKQSTFKKKVSETLKNCSDYEFFCAICLQQSHFS